MRISTLTRLAGTCVAMTAGAATFAQPQITVVGGFAYQSWNAGTNVVQDVWRPESFGSSWFDGLRWDWQELDGNDELVIPEPMAVFDPAVPGITKAYQFPAARAATIKPFDLADLPDPVLMPDEYAAFLASLGNRGPNWENNATVGESATHEIWFKANDLDGTHVLLEIGAENKGMAFALDGAELVTVVRATDGMSGNEFTYEHRETIEAGRWYQAVLVIGFGDFTMRTYLDGVQVDSEFVTPSANYRWTGGNPAGLGTIGSDPEFPDVGIAGGVIPAANFTDFDGMIATHRFYDIDLLPDEILDNYEALTDAGASLRRSDFNQDGAVDDSDQFDYVTWFANSTNAPTGPVEFPFPSSPGGGVQSNDPALDETILGDFIANRDGGFNPTGSQEPSFQFPAMNVLEPVNLYDPAVPSIRTAWVMNGLEGFRGPKFEQADDTTSVRFQSWMYFDDVSGNHCLFEAGGSGVGFSIVSLGDRIAAAVNTSANDGADEITITSAPGVLTPGWHLIELVVRRFTADTDGDMAADLGQGFEAYVDGVQVAAINDMPGVDGVFGTADDVNNFSPAGAGTSNFIGGNQGAWGQVFGTAYLPAGTLPEDLMPFNGMVGPFRLIQTSPVPADIAAQYVAESSQAVIDARNDTDGDGAATFFDVLANLEVIDAGR